MIVSELIEKLKDYNQDATVDVVVHCHPEEFSIAHGGDEGSTRACCDSVSLYVDRLCNDENQEEKTHGR